MTTDANHEPRITMNLRNITGAFFITALTLTTFLTDSYAAEPKPLTKSQAAQVLALMGYQDVEIGAVVQGFMLGAGGQNVALILGIGRIHGKIQKLEVEMYYDADLGWFRFIYDESGTPGIDYKPPTKLRIWTSSSYKEIRPKFSITDSSATEKIIGEWKTDNGNVTYTKDGQWKQTLQGKALGGTWKIEGGVMISTIVASTVESAKPGTTLRWNILSLDQSAMLLMVKDKDGVEQFVELRK